MKDFFKALFEYNLAHDQKLIALFDKHPELYQEKAGELFDHMLNAHHIWNQRMLGNKHRFGVWVRHAANELSVISTENYKDSIQLLETVNLEDTLYYKDTKGNSFQNLYKEVLFHIVNHGTYHRGQIALEFRNTGIDPVISDYIYYKRLTPQ